MLPTQVMINGTFSSSAFHRAEQGAEELLARTQPQNASSKASSENGRMTHNRTNSTAQRLRGAGDCGVDKHRVKVSHALAFPIRGTLKHVSRCARRNTRLKSPDPQLNKDRAP
uniref:Uncharacterized protein n=1 Tax=Knipowitschia caucasica TaxID=637954 RepID=A0AAV2JGS6_KNICA